MYVDPVAARLLDQIAAGEPAHLALADWLLQQPGEVERAHGALIVDQSRPRGSDEDAWDRELQLRGVVTRAHLPIQLVAGEHLAWHAGFVATATFRAERVPQVLQMPMARYLTGIHTFDESSYGLERAIEAMVETPPANLGDVSLSEYFHPGRRRGFRLRGIDRLWSLPLEQLYVMSQSSELGIIDAPLLKTLRIVGGVDDEGLAALAAARWPNLSRLELSGNQYEPDGIRGDALATMLAGAPWLGQLRVLQLWGCNLSDADIARFAPRLAADIQLDLGRR